MCSPFFGVSLGLDLEFIGHSLTFQLPIIFIDCWVDDLLFLVYRSHSDVFLIIEIILICHLCLVDHLLVILGLVLLLIWFRLVPWITSSLLRRWILISWLFEGKILAFKCLSSELRENDENLLATSALQLQGRELTVDLQFFTLIDDVSRNRHRIIVFAEIWRRDVIKREEVLD